MEEFVVHMEVIKLFYLLHIFIKDYSLFEQVFVGYFQEFDHDISCVW